MTTHGYQRRDLRRSATQARDLRTNTYAPLVFGAEEKTQSSAAWWQWLLAPIPTYLMSSDEAGKRKTADEVPAWVWVVSGGILAGAGILGYKKTQTLVKR